MKRPKIGNLSVVSWIARKNLPLLKIKKWGVAGGGCKLIRYVITTDGKKYIVF